MISVEMTEFWTVTQYKYCYKYAVDCILNKKCLAPSCLYMNDEYFHIIFHRNQSKFVENIGIILHFVKVTNKIQV